MSDIPKTTILSGTIVRDSIIPELIKRVQCLSYVPTLAIIQVGDRPDSTKFIGVKKAFAKKIGVNEQHINVPVTISEEELIATIKKCNDDPTINGIIVQLPLPPHLSQQHVIDAIDPKKDADALTKENNNRPASVLPATARGILELCNYYKINLTRKNVTVIGRSQLVGTPIAHMCRREGAVVTVCHRGTQDLVKETQHADVIISAAGVPGLVRKDHVKQGQIIIDVGLGDVDFDSVKDVVAAITPVPGGVGPMTVCALFENLLDLCEGANHT